MPRSSVRPLGADGFTLVELLVAVLVLGVLAAVAIPSFLSDAGSADNVSAKQTAVSARLAARTMALDDGGSFAGVNKRTLHEYEPTIATRAGGGTDYLSAAKGTATTYALTVTSTRTGDTFTITRSADGSVARTCKLAARGRVNTGCQPVKGRNGVW